MKRLVCISAILSAMTLLLSAGSPREVLAKYYEHARALKSLEGRLVVEIKRGDQYNYLKMRYISAGEKLYMKAPPPFAFELISDGEKAHFYSRKENTVWRYYPGQYNREFEQAVQQGKDILQDVPDLVAVGKEMLGWKKVEVYEGKPEDTQGFVSRFRIYADTENGFLYRVESYDFHDEIVSRLDLKKYRKINGVWLNLVTRSWSKAEKEVIETFSEFQEVTVNGSIDPATFEFAVPEGAELRDLTEQIIEKAREKAGKKR